MLNFRIVALTALVSMGGLLFGYDTGFIGAATTLPSFKRDFGLTEENASELSGNVVAMLQAGCFFGVIIMAFITDKVGRRLSLVVAGVVFDIGAAMQTGAKGILPLFYVGRVISGLSVGAASMLTPLMIAEAAPKKIRGALLTCYSCFLFGGIAVAYWIDYACQQTLGDDNSNQWRVPVALQIVFGSILSLGVIPLRESPRWLVKKDKRSQALENLRYLRHGMATDEEINEEFAEICEAVDLETAQTEGITWKEIFLKGNRRRFGIIISMMIQQQLTGTNCFTYYLPIFFKVLGLADNSAGLFATGVYGIVKTVFSIVGMIWIIETVGRRWSLMLGGFAMAVAQLVVACVYATHPPDENATTVSAATYIMIVMIYIFCVAYSMSWGPVCWNYIAEISSNRLREYAIASGSATQWAFNCMISKVVPIAIDNLGWRVFLMFCIFNFAGVVYTYFFVLETKGLSLEEMDALFGAEAAIDVDGAHQRAAFIAQDAEDDNLKKDGQAMHVERV